MIWIFATPWKIPGDKRKKDTPLDILQKRYAAGEINKEEYEDRKTRNKVMKTNQ
ncbi:MAG: SHOCT domain-containing protein [Ignavibacteria bacterium]